MGGGPVYLWLRATIVWLRRVPGRHWIRWLERNWDFQKFCMQGMPELHIDPTKNRWRYYVDTSYYGGMIDKAMEDFYRYIMMYPALAFFLLRVDPYQRQRQGQLPRKMACAERMSAAVASDFHYILVL